MSENDLNMIDLVITHLTHPWGPPLWFAALNSLPVVIFCHFRHSCKWPKLSFSGMYDQKWPLEVLCTGLFFCHRCVFAMSYSTPVVNRNAPTSHESDTRAATTWWAPTSLPCLELLFNPRREPTALRLIHW